MDKEIFPSILPTVENYEKLDFWQSMGVVSMLFSCHDNYSATEVNTCFSNVKAALERKRAIVFFNNDSHPVAFFSYRFYEDVQENEDSIYRILEEGDLLFDYIISPFSSPLDIYGFIKDYMMNYVGNEFKRAFLFDSTNQKLRHIW